MTTRRRNEHDNPYLDWIRVPKELDSEEHGFRVYDIDSIIWNSNTNKCIVIEAKRYDNEIDRDHQALTLERLHRALKKSDDWIFLGTFLLSFQHTSPYDGQTTFHMYDGTRWMPFTVSLNEQQVITALKRLVEEVGPPMVITPNNTGSLWL